MYFFYFLTNLSNVLIVLLLSNIHLLSADIRNTGGRYLWSRSQVALGEVFCFLTRENFCSVKVHYRIRSIDREGVFGHCRGLSADYKQTAEEKQFQFQRRHKIGALKRLPC